MFWISSLFITFPVCGRGGYLFILLFMFNEVLAYQPFLKLLQNPVDPVVEQ
jgi:hypothetical protein